MKLQMSGNREMEEKILNFLKPRVGDFYSLSLEERKRVYQRLVKGCRNCSLRWDTGYYPVPGILNKDSNVVFIGRNPNTGEVKENKILPDKYSPGRLFKRYLAILGLGEGEISVINMCNCHGSKNRPPTPTEVNVCLAFKRMEFSIIGDKYRIIFAMGNDALWWLFGYNHPGVLQCIGDVYTVHMSGRQVRIIPIIHPSHLAIAPENKENVYKVLKGSKKFIDEIRT